ncbi:MAG: hypothetical protein HY075_16515 [Deltaproteobacteria bacterium]|nr:hypothetical protein [Deltaproteobacteria bacterium]
MKTILFSLLVLSSQTAFAHDMPPVAMPKEFDTLKTLVGTWEGTSTMEGKEEKFNVEYKLTSGGTALEERTMIGSPGEMVTMYHKSGKTLAVTHFCALGNQPMMPLKKATDKSLAFEMTKPLGISSLKEMHMHAVKLTFVDADTVKQDWTNYMNGKTGESVAFTLKRKK